MEISHRELQQTRDELLENAVDFFSKQNGVVGILLAGSIPNGSDDAYSDIDLRVFTTAESHANFVERRLEMPHMWGELLFNEWTDGTEVCVSHFRPFLKIDVLYWNIDEVKPSAWFNLASSILFDPDGALKEFLTRCGSIGFDGPTSEEISRVISKALACAHESLRRTRRGELYYAQSLLERVRTYLVQMEDWINRFEPKKAADLKIEKRICRRLHAVLEEAYPSLNAQRIEESLIAICLLLSKQIVDLHNSFRLDRILENDLYAVKIILNRQIDK